MTALAKPASSLQSDSKSELIGFIEETLFPLGLSVVEIEIQHGRERKLRIFIETREGKVGIEHCVIATKALDKPLDESPIIKAIFKDASYDLEVSSPGLERPLRRESDYQKFVGRKAHIHLYRPLSAEEINHPPYLEKNPRQKHFLGVLKGLQEGKVVLDVPFAATQTSVTIPLSLISKAHLEALISNQNEGKHA